MGANVIFNVADLIKLFAALQTLKHASVVACSFVDAGLSDVVESVVNVVLIRRSVQIGPGYLLQLFRVHLCFQFNAVSTELIVFHV